LLWLPLQLQRVLENCLVRSLHASNARQGPAAAAGEAVVSATRATVPQLLGATPGCRGALGPLLEYAVLPPAGNGEEGHSGAVLLRISARQQS
jgi:hypothetical protein